jgi:hypothetical protein
LIHWSVYGFQADGPTSLICIATRCEPSGPEQPLVYQSSTFRGSVPFTKISFVENGVTLEGSSPEPYPPNAPGAVTTLASTMFAVRFQSVAGKSAKISFM